MFLEKVTRRYSSLGTGVRQPFVACRVDNDLFRLITTDLLRAYTDVWKFMALVVNHGNT